MQPGRLVPLVLLAAAAAAAVVVARRRSSATRDPDVLGSSAAATDASRAESLRVASATDYRDDVAPTSPVVGDHPSAWEDSGETATGAATPTSEAPDEQSGSGDASHDAESTSGEWGGPRHADQTDGGQGEAVSLESTDTSGVEGGGAGGQAVGDVPAPVIIGDIEEFASTEPLLVEDQAPPVQREQGDDASQATDGTVERASTDDATTDRDSTDHESTDHESTDHESTDHASTDHDRASTSGDSSLGEGHATAETGAAVTAPDDEEEAAARAHDADGNAFDPTPTRDWAADEGALLEENRQRAERLEREREDLGVAGGDSSSDDTSPPAGTSRP